MPWRSGSSSSEVATTIPSNLSHDRKRRKYLYPAIALLLATSTIVIVALSIVGSKSTATSVSPVYLAGTSSLSCETVGRCILAGTESTSNGGSTPVVVLTRDAGSSWKFGSLPIGLGQSTIQNISCWSPRNCVAVTSYGGVIGTTNGGVRWRVSGRVSVEPSNSFSDLTLRCFATNRCVLLDGGNLVALGGVGRNWKAVALPTSGDGELPTVSSFDCTESLECVAVGSIFNRIEVHPVLWTSVDEGLTWSMHLVPTQLPGNLDGITCPSSRLCYAITDNLAAVAIRIHLEGNAVTTSAPLRVNPSSDVHLDGPGLTSTSIACSSEKECMAFGVGSDPFIESSSEDSIELTANSGSSWQAVPLGALAPVSVECPNQRYCAALDLNNGELSNSILISRNEGRTWTIVQPHLK